jgi:hypothetical protein
MEETTAKDFSHESPFVFSKYFKSFEVEVVKTVDIIILHQFLSHKFETFG